MGFPLRALDYPWCTPSVPGSRVREASLSNADSSPQSASPGKSDSTTALEGEDKKKKEKEGGREGEEAGMEGSDQALWPVSHAALILDTGSGMGKDGFPEVITAVRDGCWLDQLYITTARTFEQHIAKS